jgi:hypothetical protein
MGYLISPPKKLHEILIQTRGYRYGENILTSSSDKKKIKDMWKEVLEVGDENESDLLFSVGKLIMLVREVEAIVEKLDEESKSICLPAINKIKDAFSKFNFDELAEGFADKIDDMTLQTLSFIGILVSKENNFSNIDKVKLEDLKSQIENVIQEAYQSEIQDEFKEFIIEKLKTLKKAIDDHIYYGLNNIKSAIHEGVGGLYLYEELKNEVNENKDSKIKGLFLKTMKVFSDANIIVNLGKNVIPLIELFSKNFIN